MFPTPNTELSVFIRHAINWGTVWFICHLAVHALGCTQLRLLVHHRKPQLLIWPVSAHRPTLIAFPVLYTHTKYSTQEAPRGVQCTRSSVTAVWYKRIKINYEAGMVDSQVQTSWRTVIGCEEARLKYYNTECGTVVEATAQLHVS